MDNLTKALITQSDFAKDELRKTLDKLHVLYRDIEHYSEILKRGHDDYKAEVRLRASLLLFESYFYKWISLPEYSGFKKDDPRKTGTMNFTINGSWLTHEMGRLFFSVNTIFHLFAVRDIGLQKIKIDSDSEVITRKDVYENAKLFYYLRSQEELKIKRIVFSSPGIIGLLNQLPALMPSMKDTVVVLYLVYIASRAIRELPSIYRNYVEEITNSREKLRHDEKKALLHQFFKKKKIPLINDECKEDNKKILNPALRTLEQGMMLHQNKP